MSRTGNRRVPARRTLLAAAAPWLTACGPLPDPPRVSPTRSAADCAPVASQVRQNPAAYPSVGPWIESAVPPTRTPLRLQGRTVRIELEVDERGRVRPESVRLSGLNDPAFEEQLRERVVEYTFFPAVYEGCAVPSRTVLTQSF